MFDKWKQTIQPLLWFEMRQLCKTIGISIDSLITRRTFFTVEFDEKNELLQVIPHLLYDPSRNVLLFDKQQKVQFVLGPEDEQEIEPIPQESNMEESIFSSISDVNIEELREKLYNELKMHTNEILNKFLKLWLDSLSSSIQNEGRHEMFKKSLINRKSWKAVKYLNSLCYNSAGKELEKALGRAFPLYPELYLLKVILLCSLRFHDPKKVIAGYLSRKEFISPDVQTLLMKTESCPGGIEILESYVRKDLTIVMDNLDKKAESYTEKESGQRFFAVACESLKIYLALVQALENLSETHETRRTILSKVSEALEMAWAPEFTYSTSQVGELLDLIVGHKIYGSPEKE